MRSLSIAAIALTVACGGEGIAPADCAGDASDPVVAVDDAGPEAADGNPEPVQPDGADEPEPFPPLPPHALERPCGASTDDDLDCPEWLGDRTVDFECSPSSKCSVRCDVFLPCQPPADTPPPVRGHALRECQMRDAVAPKYAEREWLVAECTALGGTCSALPEQTGVSPGTRSWCVLP